MRIGFTGDLMLGGLFLDYARAARLDLLHPFQLLNPLFRNLDLVVVNLEGPLAGGTDRRTGRDVILRNHEAVVEWLGQLNRCICVLGNNHILDYGAEELRRTIRLLRAKNISVVGAGVNAASATNPTLVQVGEQSVCCFSYTSDEPHVGGVIATRDGPGCVSWRDGGRALADVAAARRAGHLVIVSIHWGYEFHHYPAPEQGTFARDLLNAGAKVVVGHHPHVVQGIEEISGGLVAYSLGHFFVPPFRDVTGRLTFPKPASREFALLKCEIAPSDPLRWRISGGRMRPDYTLKPYEAGEQQRFEDRIKRLSAPLAGNDYARFWKDYSTQRERRLRWERIVEKTRGWVRPPESEWTTPGPSRVS